MCVWTFVYVRVVVRRCCLRFIRNLKFTWIVRSCSASKVVPPPQPHPPLLPHLNPFLLPPPHPSIQPPSQRKSATAAADDSAIAATDSGASAAADSAIATSGVVLVVCMEDEGMHHKGRRDGRGQHDCMRDGDEHAWPCVVVHHTSGVPCETNIVSSKCILHNWVQIMHNLHQNLFCINEINRERFNCSFVSIIYTDHWKKWRQNKFSHFGLSYVRMIRTSEIYQHMNMTARPFALTTTSWMIFTIFTVSVTMDRIACIP